MPLTPADVHNVAFSKPPIGKRGYNEDEVDAFLDLVEAELARLIEENDDLREQVSQLEQRLGNAQADLEDARSRPPGRDGAGLAADAADAASGRAPPIAAADGAAARDGCGPPQLADRGDLGGDHHVQAAKVLEHGPGDGRPAHRRGQVRGRHDAHRRPHQVRAAAVGRPHQVRRPRQRRARRVPRRCSTTRVPAPRPSSASPATRPPQLVGDAERKQTEIIGSITRDKSVLEKKIDELRTFEREYRTRLKTYLESQLRDLGERGSAAPSDSRAGATAGTPPAGTASAPTPVADQPYPSAVCAGTTPPRHPHTE